MKVNVKSCNAQIDESLLWNMSLSTECAAALPSFRYASTNWPFLTRVTHNSPILTNPWPSNSRSNGNLEMLVFEEGGKPGEKPSEQGREPTTNSTTYDTLVGGERSHHCAIPAPLCVTNLCVKSNMSCSLLKCIIAAERAERASSNINRI